MSTQVRRGTDGDCVSDENRRVWNRSSYQAW